MSQPPRQRPELKTKHKQQVYRFRARGGQFRARGGQFRARGELKKGRRGLIQG
jgi:hypothetical protein